MTGNVVVVFLFQYSSENQIDVLDLRDKYEFLQPFQASSSKVDISVVVIITTSVKVKQSKLNMFSSCKNRSKIMRICYLQPFPNEFK